MYKYGNNTERRLTDTSCHKSVANRWRMLKINLYLSYIAAFRCCVRGFLNGLLNFKFKLHSIRLFFFAIEVETAGLHKPAVLLANALLMWNKGFCFENIFEQVMLEVSLNAVPRSHFQSNHFTLLSPPSMVHNFTASTMNVCIHRL